MIPNTKIGHIGLYRNEETLEPVQYYYKMPKNIKDKEVIILDQCLQQVVLLVIQLIC